MQILSPIQMQGWFLAVGMLGAGAAYTADETTNWALTDAAGLQLHNVEARGARLSGKDGLEVAVSAESRAQMAQARSRQQAAGISGPPTERTDHLVVLDSDFHNGVIELELAGSPAPGAEGGGARGFVGVAFRVQEDLATYECFYLRPTNGRADDQERRNHSAQYVSHPMYSWYRLREETPSRYESYVDLRPGAWTRVRIEVQDGQAKLYVHGTEQPTLIVNDLKLGPDRSGSVALWIEGSTIAHFRNLTITRQARTSS